MRRELLEQTDEPWPRAGRRAKGTNWATELSQTNGQKAKHANCMCMPALQAKLTSCIMSRAASCESGSNLMANSTFRKWLGSRADSTRRPPLDQPCQRAVPTSRTCERSPQAHTHTGPRIVFACCAWLLHKANDACRAFETSRCTKSTNWHKHRFQPRAQPTNRIHELGPRCWPRTQLNV